GRGGSRMPPARLVAVLVLGVALLAIRPVTAAAQSELQAWLNPEMGKQIPRADYRYTFYPERKVEDQQTHFTMTEQRVTLFAPLYQDSTDEQVFGRTLPVPGIAYAWVPSDRFRAVIGFPFSMIQYKPFESLTLDAEYFPIYTVRSRATWEIFRPLRAYVGFQWDSDHFYRAVREDKDDKIFYRELRLYAGIRCVLRYIGFVVTGGYALY